MGSKTPQKKKKKLKGTENIEIINLNIMESTEPSIIERQWRKSPNRKFNNWLLNNLWVKEEVSVEMKKKFFELNKNKSMTNQNLWYVANAVLRNL